MNLNPNPETNTTKNQNQEENQNDIEETNSEKKKTYTIFVDLPNYKLKEEISLRKEATIEDAIAQVINLDDQKFKDININDLEVYLASGNGEPDDDCPAIEQTQIISHVNFEKFVIVLKNDEDFCEENDGGEEGEVNCCSSLFGLCFKKKKKEEDVYMKIG